ncbi:MAG: type II toxin-antitoxin system ParD family antitoxin [Hasllibacter sp.]
MTVKRSVSLHDEMDAFARAQVEQGRSLSLSAVVHEGLRELRAKREREARERAEEDAFLEMLRKRAEGPFLTMEEFRESTERMIREESRRLGLED